MEEERALKVLRDNLGDDKVIQLMSQQLNYDDNYFDYLYNWLEEYGLTDLFSWEGEE